MWGSFPLYLSSVCSTGSHPGDNLLMCRMKAKGLLDALCPGASPRAATSLRCCALPRPPPFPCPSQALSLQRIQWESCRKGSQDPQAPDSQS